MPADARELLGLLLGQPVPERAALLGLVRRWSALPADLRLAVLHVAGVECSKL
ncbi:MAG: hypothetical protein IT454_12600 [Planctomycetes bacterium]|nr:hypothetical protein [Planctomycetota bacterium]